MQCNLWNLVTFVMKFGRFGAFLTTPRDTPNSTLLVGLKHGINTCRSNQLSYPVDYKVRRQGLDSNRQPTDETIPRGRRQKKITWFKFYENSPFRTPNSVVKVKKRLTSTDDISETGEYFATGFEALKLLRKVLLYAINFFWPLNPLSP